MTDQPNTHGPLARATELLRQHTDAGWTAISADVLSRALRAFRPSAPVRGSHDLGDYFIACDVIVAHLRDAIDAIPHTAATRITCTTNTRHELDNVTVQITAAYGTHLLTLSQHIHTVTAHHLETLLGPLTPPATAIHTHVHIGDISDDHRDIL